MSKAFDLWHIDVPGIVVPCPSGIRFSNQVGGTYCGHPEVEGAFIPFPDELRGIDINDGACGITDYYEDAYSPDVVAAFLAESKLDRYFEPLAEGEEFYGTLAEAWVPVRVRPGLIQGRHGWTQLSQLEGRTVIVTCVNSD